MQIIHHGDPVYILYEEYGIPHEISPLFAGRDFMRGIKVEYGGVGGFQHAVTIKDFPGNIDVLWTDQMTGCMSTGIIGYDRGSGHWDAFYSHMSDFNLRSVGEQNRYIIDYARDFISNHELCLISFGTGPGVLAPSESTPLLSRTLGFWARPADFVEASGGAISFFPNLLISLPGFPHVLCANMPDLTQFTRDSYAIHNLCTHISKNKLASIVQRATNQTVPAKMLRGRVDDPLLDRLKLRYEEKRRGLHIRTHHEHLFLSIVNTDSYRT